MKRLIIILALALLLISCRSSREISNIDTMSATRDSTSHELREEVQTTKVTVAGDSALIRALLACDSNGQVYLRQLEVIRGQRILPEFILKNNRILVPIKVDSMSIYHKYKNIFEKNVKTSSSAKVRTEYKYVKVTVTDWWRLILFTLGGFASGLIASFVVRLIKKIRSKSHQII